MRSKPIVLLAVALGCGGVAAFAASQVVQDRPSQAIETVDILVAANDIAVNTRISPERFVLEKWPRDRLPVGFVQDPKLVEGKFTNQRLFQGEPLLERKINTSRESVAQTIPVGYRVFDFAVDKDRGATGYIQPGDRVDVHGFFDKGGKLLESKSILVIENVEVFMVDGIAVRGEETEKLKQASVIQLLIRSSQFEALNTAENLGKLKLSLTPPQADEKDKDKTDNGEQFLEWARSAVVEAAPPTTVAVPQYAMEPVQTRAAKKMVVISPAGTETYEWDRDGDLPLKVSGDSIANAQSFAGTSNSRASGDTPYDSPNPQSSSTGMIWDGMQWTWGGTGFKPTYPSADDDNTGKENNSASKSTP
ncbi:MAG: Flp pilus assembly protein CpaB [Planctomycetota bacterium]|nr:Flp pilus assembly protein CpaB [Planctomycetota bacterium]